MVPLLKRTTNCWLARLLRTLSESKLGLCRFGIVHEAVVGHEDRSERRTSRVDR